MNKEEIRNKWLDEVEKRPPDLQLEMTSFCNATCVICPHVDMTRPKGTMDYELWCDVLDQYAEVELIKGGSSYTNPLMHPFWFGEAMLVKDYAKYIRTVREKLPNTRIDIFDNCSKLTKENAEALIDAKPYVLVVSFEGGTPEAYEKMRPGLKWNETVGNVHRFIELRNEAKSDIQVWVHCTQTPETEKDYHLLQKEFSDADNVGLTTFQIWAGKVEDRGLSKRQQTLRPCWRLWNQFVVGWDGKVYTCCDDNNGEQCVGDITKERMMDIWTGDKMNYYREKHLDRDFSDLALCSRCWWGWIGTPEWWWD